MPLTRQECLDRAGLYEEAAEHLEICWDQVANVKPAFEFVVRHLRREIDRWEVEAEGRHLPQTDKP